MGTTAERKLLTSVDMETAQTSVPMDGSPPTSIVIRASSPNLTAATLTIPLSVDELSHGVLPSAQQSMSTQQRWV